MWVLDNLLTTNYITHLFTNSPIHFLSNLLSLVQHCNREHSMPFHQTAGRIWRHAVCWAAHKIKTPIPRTQAANVRSDCLLQHCSRLHGTPLQWFFSFSHNPSSCGHPLRLSIPLSNTNTDKHFFSNNVVIPWNPLPTDLVDITCPKSFKNQLGKINLSKFLIFPTIWTMAPLYILYIASDLDFFYLVFFITFTFTFTFRIFFVHVLNNLLICNQRVIYNYDAYTINVLLKYYINLPYYNYTCTERQRTVFL